MQRLSQLGVAVAVCFLILLGVFMVRVHAQSTPPPATRYHLESAVVSSAGQIKTSGGSYELGGTLSQVGVGVIQGGSYVGGAGFWSRVQSEEFFTYLPAILRSTPAQ